MATTPTHLPCFYSSLLTLTLMAIASVHSSPHGQFEVANSMISQCPVYKCSDALDQMHFCSKQDIVNPLLVHLKQCPKGQKCNQAVNQCESDPYKKVVGLLPQHACLSDFQCLSGACLNNQCLSTFTLTGQCSEHRDCDVGTFCNSQTRVCEKQLPIGSQCSNDYECQNNLACNLNSCVEYGSLHVFEPADNSLACSSGFSGVLSPEQDDSSAESVCLPSPTIVNQVGPNYQCSSSADSCIYQSVSPPVQVSAKPTVFTTFEHSCQCGFTALGRSYCPNIFTSDYTSLLYTVTSRYSLHKCHTQERTNTYECLLRNLTNQHDLDVINSFILQHFEREENHHIRDNDQCMKTNSQTSAYWEAKGDSPRNKPDETATSGALISQPSFLLFVCCYLLIALISYK